MALANTFDREFSASKSFKTEHSKQESFHDKNVQLDNRAGFALNEWVSERRYKFGEGYS